MRFSNFSESVIIVFIDFWNSYFFHTLFFDFFSSFPYRYAFISSKNMKKTPVLFDLWNEQKKTIEFSHQSKRDARIGEFWWYREGVNIGNEISKD